MVAHTPAWGLEYPDDYQQPADSPNALEALAVTTDAALSSVANTAHTLYAQIMPATTWVDERQITAYAFPPVTIQPGQEFTLGPFGITPGALCVCGTNHASTYLLTVYHDLGDGTAIIKVRNTTLQTPHSNVIVHAIFINPPGA